MSPLWLDFQVSSNQLNERI